MKKKTITQGRLLTATSASFLLPLVFLLLIQLTGCIVITPDPDPKETEEEEELIPISFRVGIEGYEDVVGTKSLDPSLSDENVDRLDIFSWNSDGSIAGHLVFTPAEGETLLDLAKITPIFHGPKNAQRTYLAMANLDPDTAAYIGGLSSSDMMAYPTRVIPWSAGNCRPDRPVMGGTAKAVFGTTKSIAFSLMKYCCKIEVGTITLDIPDMPDRDMSVTKVIIINGWDMLRMCMTAPTSFAGNPSDLFGSAVNAENNPWTVGESGYYSANLFVNKIEKEELGLDARYVFSETYSLASYGGTGKLASSYPRVYNENYMVEMYGMHISDSPALQTVSMHEFTSSQGRLSSSDGTRYGPVSVNRTFQTLPTHYTVFTPFYTQPVDLPDQRQYFEHLVVVVNVDGVQYFYPILLDGLLPGRHYLIENITLRGEPSAFCNGWIKNCVMTRSTDHSSPSIIKPDKKDRDGIIHISDIVL